MYIVLFLSCLLSTDTVVSNQTPSLSVDRIEINHFWTTRSSDVGNITLEEGYCSMDQLIIWKYNSFQDRFDVVHWEILKFQRKKNRIPPEEFNAHMDKINAKRREIQKQEAKRNGMAQEDLIVYLDSDWLGFNSELNRPRYNFSTEKYEVSVNIQKNNKYHFYKFVAPSLVETNTLFDPEAIFRSTVTTFKGKTQFDGFTPYKVPINPILRGKYQE